MDTTTFFSSLYPRFGVRVLAVFKNGLGSAPTHQFFESDGDLIEAATTYNSLGKNVYHACAVYAEPINRKSDNVAAVKALWADLDVGPNKPHGSLQEAVDSVKHFATAVGIPQPWYVTSGSGLHAYWPFTVAITAKQWLKLAGLFRTVLDHRQVQHDSSRTQDIASILRVPGTNNYKTTPAKPVRILKAGTDTPVVDLFKALKAYADANQLLVLEVPVKPVASATSDLVGHREFPPSYGENITKHCAVLAEIDSTGGDAPYEVWWRAIGVAKHLHDGEAVAAHWTRNREATGHTKYDVVAVLNGWKAGPTTCGDMSRHTDKCATCIHFKPNKSPIMLGLDAVPEAKPDPIEPKQQELPEPWDFQAQWLLDRMKTRHGIGYSNGKLTMSLLQEDGTYKHQPFCDRYWQVMRRIQEVDGTWKLEIGFVKYAGEPYRTFKAESAVVSAPDKLKQLFSANEVHIYGGPKGMAKSQELLRAQQEILAGHRMETITYPVMGWTSENPVARGKLTGNFVLGNIMFSPRVLPQEIMLADTVTPGLAVDFGTAGTLNEWVASIDHVYNRRGAEPYQFLLAAMFASPLIRLVSESSNWHGIPISLTGNTGSAKTSTALIAMSIYGRPNLFMFSLTESAGDTLNALSLKMGALNNIPFIADECSGRDPVDIMKVMYMQANGMSRDRMLPTGQMMVNPYRWDMTSIITANDSLHEKLTELRNRQVSDATQARCFEITLTKEGLAKVFHDINGNEFVAMMMDKQYGHVGRAWIQYLVNHRESIADMYKKMRDKYSIDNDDSTDTRYYSDLLCVTEFAARLARRLGFITWDVNQMMDWAKDQSRRLKDNLSRDDWEGHISDFIGSLHGRTIVTKKMSLGRGRRSSVQVEHPMESIGTNVLPVARRAIEDKIFVVTVNALTKWAQDNKVAAKAMVEQMLRRGYILNRTGDKTAWRQISIGSGTTVVRPQAPCYELDYMAATKFSEGDDDATNVVPFPAPVATFVQTTDINPQVTDQTAT